MSHFYTKTESGVETRHFVQMAKDPSRTRPSRITDARKARKESGEVWVPSVTTILNMLDKPALVNWKVDQNLSIAYTLDPSQYDDVDSYLKAVKVASRESMDSAPKAGTAIHKVLEDFLFVDDKSSLPKIEQQLVINCENVISEMTGLDSRDDWIFEEYFLDDENGFAGCADLVSKNFCWCIDYKSKQEKAKFKPGKMAYPDHTRQLGAYMRGFNASPTTMKAANLFVCLEDAAVDFHEHDSEALENGWLDFKDCVSIYQRNVYKAGE